MTGLVAFALRNWQWVLVGLAFAGLGILYGIDEFKIADLERAAAETALNIEHQKTEAANMLAAETAKTAAWQARYAALQQTASDRYADDQEKIAAAGNSNRALNAEFLRQVAGCRAGRADAGKANPAPSEGGERSAPGKPDLLLGPGEDDFAKVGEDADVILSRLRQCRTERMGLTTGATP